MRIKQKNIFFHEISYSEIRNSIIILDIDGTLMCSSKSDIDENVLSMIRKLQKDNLVYVFSNNFDEMRSRQIASRINIPFVESPYKKPNKKVLKYIDEKKDEVFVIGDKYLTDGLFARFTKSHFIKVNRYRCKKDSYFDKMNCLLDDIVFSIVCWVSCVK